MHIETRALEANSVTGSTAIKASAGMIHSITLAAGSDDATLTVYDNSSAAAGEVEWYLAAAKTTSESITFSRPLKCNTGIYVAVTGTAPRASIQYE